MIVFILKLNYFYSIFMIQFLYLAYLICKVNLLLALGNYTLNFFKLSFHLALLFDKNNSHLITIVVI